MESNNDIDLMSAQISRFRIERMYNLNMPPIRAKAYIRVSTDHEDQLNSLHNQNTFWENYINSLPNHIFCGLYADEGISGTSLNKRNNFNKMMKEKDEDKYDYLFTKSVSRWARNTVDCLSTVRELKSYKKGVVFHLESLDTLADTNEMILTIHAMLAQSKSEELSKSVRWAQHKQMEEGFVQGGNRILGYELIKGVLTINLKEAPIIQRIFREFLNGKSTNGIATDLNNEGIKGKLGGKFTSNTIRQILLNEKYCGDLIQLKNYIEDVLTHKEIKNDGKYKKIVIPNHHEPIISKEDWLKTQEILNERHKLYHEQRIGVAKSPWNGKIICETCNAKYRRVKFYNSKQQVYYSWVCKTSYSHGLKTCTNGGYIREEILNKALQSILKEIINNKDKANFIKEIMSDVDDVLDKGDNNQEIENSKKQIKEIQNRKTKLLNLYLDDDYENEEQAKKEFKEKKAELDSLELNLQNSLYQLENRELILKNKQKTLAEIYDILIQKINFETQSDTIINNFVDKVTIKNKIINIYLKGIDHYQIDLKSSSPFLAHCYSYDAEKDKLTNIEELGYITITTLNIDISLNDESNKKHKYEVNLLALM